MQKSTKRITVYFGKFLINQKKGKERAYRFINFKYSLCLSIEYESGFLLMVARRHNQINVIYNQNTASFLSNGFSCDLLNSDNDFSKDSGLA